MPSMLQWILTGLAQLIIDQIETHKDDIEKMLIQFLESLFAKLTNSGHADTVHKIQAVVSSHVD